MKALKASWIVSCTALALLQESISSPAVAEVSNSPTRLTYTVEGDGVAFPGTFEFREGLTLTNAIRTAGGFVRWAHTNKVELTRRGALQPLIIDVAKIQQALTNDVSIEPGDLVHVRGPNLVQQKWRDLLDRQGQPGKHAAAPLTAAEAQALAVKLANEKARELYNVEPFHSAPPAQLLNGQWIWHQSRGLGNSDIEADVTFMPDGSNPNVRVTRLFSIPQSRAF